MATHRTAPARPTGGVRFTRRTALRSGIGAAGALALGPSLLGEALEAMAAPAVPGPGPYGALGAADANGLRLPPGFTSRLIARAKVPVEGTAYTWHTYPDGMGSFATGDGGYILTSNSEVPALQGGASAIRFDASGQVTAAQRILAGTSSNCAGGVTPWGTWLSCEETNTGRVWECAPAGAVAAQVHPAMGVFKHEAACVDPAGQRLYMTEDLDGGGFYRFTPAAYPDLSAGLLEIATVGDDGRVSWTEVPDPSAAVTPTRQQVAGSTQFKRGEGMWFDAGTVYFATTTDDRVYAYRPASGEIEVLYDGVALGDTAPLHDTDNVTVSPKSGELFVAEDGDDLQICVVTPEGEVAAFAQLTGADHTGSEVTGPVFDPSGTRLYFSSQRAFGFGAVYELTGPFRLQRPTAPGAPGAEAGASNGPGAALGVTVRVLGKPSIGGLLGHGLPIRVTVDGVRAGQFEVSAQLVGPLRGSGTRTAPRSLAGDQQQTSSSSARLLLRPEDGSKELSRLASSRTLRAKLIVSVSAGDREARKTKRVRFD